MRSGKGETLPLPGEEPGRAFRPAVEVEAALGRGAPPGAPSRARTPLGQSRWQAKEEKVALLRPSVCRRNITGRGQARRPQVGSLLRATFLKSRYPAPSLLFSKPDKAKVFPARSSTHWLPVCVQCFPRRSLPIFLPFTFPAVQSLLRPLLTEGQVL